MVRVSLPLRAITVVVAVSAFGGGDGLVQASPCGHAPHGRVTIDGVTVPVWGPLLAVVPVPSINFNYAAKIEPGK